MGGIGSAIGGLASGAAGALLGGGGGSDPSVQTGQQPTMTPQQRRLLDLLSKQAATGIEEGVDPYPGTRTPEASPLQEQLFGRLEDRQLSVMDQLDDWATGMMDYDPGAAEGLLGRGMQGDVAQGLMERGQQMLQQSPQTMTPDEAREYWQQSFVEPARQQFHEETLPSLDERYAGMGAMSGSGFEKAIADAAGRMDTQLGSQLGQIMYGQREQEMGRQLQRDLQEQQMGGQLLGMGLDTGTSLGQMLLQDRSRHDQLGLQQQQLGLGGMDRAFQQFAPLMQAGQMQRGIEQQQLEEDYQDWQTTQGWGNPWLQVAQVPLQGQAFQNYATAQQGSPGLLGSMMPGIGQGIGQAIPGMLSGGGNFSYMGQQPYIGGVSQATL